MNDEIDLEDIECRLYSQVYHSNIDNEEINTPESNITSQAHNKIYNSNRYFSGRYISGPPVFIPLEEENNTNSGKDSPSIHNSISFNPNSTDITTEGSFGTQFQNNITVNQYTLPFIINPELREVLSPRGSRGTLFVPWSVENKKLLDKKNRKQQRRLENRRRRNKEKRTQNAVEYNSCLRVNTPKNKANHIVFISDDSDNECVIVTEMCKNNSKAKEKTQVTTTSENLGSETDDDIIYIPPPPIEVINVDIDNDNTESIPEVIESVAFTDTENAITSTDPIMSPDKSNCELSGPTELLHTSDSCTFNDFLDNSGVENDTGNFNFSLHGSDFNNTGDFVRPANPVEYCETESSCSTNDFNKETNSVKTIVFNEIDFPKEDIFSDKNLEGFSTYITPKRNISKESKIRKKSSKSASRTVNESDTSSSSSESDYESSSNVNINIREGDIESYKKLPTLSPMQCERTPSKKLCKKNSTKSQGSSKLQATSSAKKDSDKRKSSTLESTESLSDTNDESKLVTKKLPKKRKKSLSKKGNSSDEPSANNIELATKDSEVTIDVGNSNSGESADTSIHEKRVKKKFKNSMEKVPGNNEANSKENNDTFSDHIDDVNREDGSELINNDMENINTDNANITRKKKKKNLSNCKKSEVDNSPASNSSETSLERGKRKKKKSISSENSRSDMGRVLNRLSLKINNSIIEDETNKDNFASNDKKGVSCSEVASDEPLENPDKSVPHTRHMDENKTDTDKNKLPQEEPSIEGGFVENVNKTISSPLDTISLGDPETQERDEEIIILDEVDSQNSCINEDCIEIVESSDSEYDFKHLEDVGHDLELANCSVNMGTRKEFIDIGDIECYTNVKDNNLCEDYNKFDVEQIQNSQSDDPEIWKILPRDQLLYLNPNNNKGPRCNRCRHFGHIAVRCTEKPDPPKCTLCGFSDHQEPRCPNKRCTQCGNEGEYSTIYCWKCVKFRNSICRICDMKGHIAKTCPDLWRRYHLTTQEGPVVVLEDPQLKPRDQLWCSGCAEQGHLEYECNYYNREYPPTNPCIISYEDVLHEGDRDKFRNRTPSPPPPPMWNSPPQNNFYRPISSYPNLPSTSQNIPFTSPIFIPQLPNLNQIFPGPNMINQNEMMIPNNDANCNPNFTPASTKVINPFSVLVRQKKNISHDQILNQMMLDYVNDRHNITYNGCYDSDKGKVIHPHLIKHAANELLKNDQRRVKHTFMSMPPNIVKQFLRTELDELENVVSRSNPKYLKKKLFKCDKLPCSRKALSCDVVKEKCFWYRILNMFIFGVHHFNDGKLHLNYIKKYLSEPKHNKFDSLKRKSLLNAYNYIFDANRHVNVNYYKIMQQLIDRFSDGN